MSNITCLEQHAYKSLKGIISERTKPFVFWIGAGASIEADFPDWNGLKEILFNATKAKADGFSGTEGERRRREIHSLINGSKETDSWTIFSRLKSESLLGETSFLSVIRDTFKEAPTVKIPDIYKKIWKLKPQGVLTLNIDRLSSRSASEHGLSNIFEFDGYRAKGYTGQIMASRQFVANLHGTHEDAHSWVFTKQQLDALLTDQGYAIFLQHILTSSTTIFIGINPTDIAIKSHLEPLKEQGLNLSNHYWICNNSESEIDLWAERQAGLQIIRYKDHAEIKSILEDFTTHKSIDESINQPVIKSYAPYSTEKYTPEELLKRPIEETRNILNSMAKGILKESNENGYKKYEDFVAQYEQAVHMAWFVPSKPNSMLLGYNIEKIAAEGAFGKVFKGTDSNGRDVAIKLLHQKVKDKREYAQSFRRGIKSMQILGQNDIPGIVKFIDASEIPTLVIMDWINGFTLGDAKKQGILSDWPTIIDTALKIVTIIKTAHGLPERVLHRDLRPSNIMLRDYYENNSIEIVVLDFDLSYHKGALEQSISYDSGIGYLAPEQLKKTSVSTRHAAVDSFSLGMLLYFLTSGRDPMPEQNEHKSWSDTVIKNCMHIGSCEWKAIPRRVARIILNSTKSKQLERLDVGQILGELTVISNALNESKGDIDLVAEELLCRSDFSNDFKWDDEKNRGYFKSVATEITVQPILTENSISIQIEWTRNGMESHDRIFDAVKEVIKQIESKFKQSGWEFLKINDSKHAFNVIGKADVHNVSRDINRNGALINQLHSICTKLSNF